MIGLFNVPRRHDILVGTPGDANGLLPDLLDKLRLAFKNDCERIFRKIMWWTLP